MPLKRGCDLSASTRFLGCLYFSLPSLGIFFSFLLGEGGGEGGRGGNHIMDFEKIAHMFRGQLLKLRMTVVRMLI